MQLDCGVFHSFWSGGLAGCISRSLKHSHYFLSSILATGLPIAGCSVCRNCTLEDSLCLRRSFGHYWVSCLRFLHSQAHLFAVEEFFLGSLRIHTVNNRGWPIASPIRNIWLCRYSRNLFFGFRIDDVRSYRPRTSDAYPRTGYEGRAAVLAGSAPPKRYRCLCRLANSNDFVEEADNHVSSDGCCADGLQHGAYRHP